MARNKPQVAEENVWSILKIIGLIIFCYILGYFLFDFLFDTSKEDYNYCIEDCVSDQESCITWIDSVSDRDGEEYLPQLEVESCSSDLDSCTSDCYSMYR
jgi:hypothetical protein